jgi:hypothetical protein
MPSIRIARFAGLLPEVSKRLLAVDHAQIAHNCLLWDGQLKPMPTWNSVTTVGGLASLYFDPTQNNNFNVSTQLTQAFVNIGGPFETQVVEGISALVPKRVYFFDNSLMPLGIPQPTFSIATYNFTNTNKSVYPIARTYAVTYMQGNLEGPPTVLPQLGTNGNLFEGDIVNIILNLNLAEIAAARVNAMRIYRTVPGFDTSEELANPLETGFHLVGLAVLSGSQMSFTDSNDSSMIPGDLLITDQWMPPVTPPSGSSVFFDQLEGGWGVFGYCKTSALPSILQFSERYIHHAWPPQSLINIPDAVTAIAIYYDTVFIGTQNIPYLAHVAQGDGDSLDIQVRKFPDEFACVPNSMVTTNAGAMFVSQDGLIALSNESGDVASKKVANPGDSLVTPTTSFKFYDVTQTAWWNGLFFGFTGSGGYIYNQPSAANNEYPLGQLVTIDLPSGAAGPNVTTGSGLFAAWGNTVYSFPLPGYNYDSATKATYTWKSKRFVLPGLTTFAGAKVVNDNSGNLTVTINGYNSGGESTPSFTYTRTLNHSNPWRLTHQHKCLEWEIILSGTAIVNEFHMATSFRDLIETPGE